MDRLVDMILILCALGFVAIIAFLGASINQTRYNVLKKQCARDNNVYECVIVAVPKEGEK